MDAKTEWAPARIYLQREQGEGGSHTWCEDSVGDGDMIEEVAYVRADVAATPSDAAQAPNTWNAIPSLPPVEVMEWYGDQFSAPVLLRDADRKVLMFVARWSFAEDGWVGAHFTEGPAPSDYEWLNERAKEWILLSDAAPVAPAAAAPINWRELLAAVLRESRDEGGYSEAWSGTENAPGHAHDVAGIWDSDNHVSIAGKPCSWCIAWNAARSALANKGDKQ